MTRDSQTSAAPSPNPLPQGERASFVSPSTDIPFLLHATRLAERGLGRTWPNPSVGCVIVNNNHIMGVGRTADGGRPHAETEALKQAGDAARGATAYVSLEPCAHHGKTPPCAQALIDAGITRVVIGCEDPDPRVSGKGASMLRAAGIEVVIKPTPEAIRLNKGFFRRIAQNLPHIAMKLATSQDYFMARGDGGGQWLTGEFARQHGHLLRAQFDCIVTGIGTVLADDPLLTVRPPITTHPNLVRVVCDRRLRLPLKSRLVKTANQIPLWVITSAEAVELAASHATELREAGVKFLVVEDIPPPRGGRLGGGPSGHMGAYKSLSPDAHSDSYPSAAQVLTTPPPQPSPSGGESLSPRTILSALATEGITRAFIEAGPTLSAAFLAAGLVETLHWYRAPLTLGNAGKSPIDTLNSSLASATRTDTRALGDDTYERYEL